MPPLPQFISRRPIEQLDLSRRSYNALKKRGIHTFGDLLEVDDAELLRLPWFGRKCLAEVHRIIHELVFASTEGSDRGRVLNANLGYPTAPCSPHSSTDQSVPQASNGGWVIPSLVKGDLDALVDSLDFSVRVSNVLAALEIKSVRQLLTFSKTTLKKAKNIGRKSMAEVEVKLFECLSGRSKPDVSLGTRDFISRMLASLAQRDQSILADRYGLWDGVAETLQDIGDKLGVTRERIRQVEARSLAKIRRRFGLPLAKKHVVSRVQRVISKDFDANCGVLNEEELIAAMADDCTFDEATLAVAFLQDVHGFKGDLFAACLLSPEEGVYCIEPSILTAYAQVLEIMKGLLDKYKKPLAEARLWHELEAESAGVGVAGGMTLGRRILAISPALAQWRNGTVVLSSWSVFRRRDAASLAEAALMVLGRPAHFSEIKQKVSVLYPELGEVDERGLHNRLMARRDKFVWVANGTYGLKAWGLKKPPYLKERLAQLLSEVRYPLPYWYLKDKVLEVCNCRESSVRMTLDLNSKVFKKFENDQYGLREHYEKRRP